jgi:hypothetical protein
MIDLLQRPKIDYGAKLGLATASRQLKSRYSQRDIQSVQFDLATVNREYILRNRAKTNIKLYIDGRLPEGYEKCRLCYFA